MMSFASPDLFANDAVIGSLSGGTGSWAGIKRWSVQNGTERLRLLFTDTLCEDQDGYRFLIAGAANILGVSLPPGLLPEIHEFPDWTDRAAYKSHVLALRDRVRSLLPSLIWLTDGRDPWDVFRHERFLGNSSFDPCSKILKRRLALRWMRRNCAPGTRVIVGIDHEEWERFEDEAGRGIRARMAADGFNALAPLCERPWLSWAQRLDWLTAEGLWLPRLNAAGFTHNNCGGGCCKAGQGHWSLMYRVFPERFAFAKAEEREIIELVGQPVAMLMCRRGGEKRPLTLEELETRIRADDVDPGEAADMGGCRCFLPSVPDPEDDVEEIAA